MRWRLMYSKKYSPGDIVDLDDVVPSPAALAAWSGVARRVIMFCLQIGMSEDDMPKDEQAKLNPDESLSIFVIVKTPSGGEVSFDMSIPPGEWRWK